MTMSKEKKLAKLKAACVYRSPPRGSTRSPRFEKNEWNRVVNTKMSEAARARYESGNNIAVQAWQKALKTTNGGVVPRKNTNAYREAKTAMSKHLRSPSRESRAEREEEREEMREVARAKSPKRKRMSEADKLNAMTRNFLK